MLSPTEHLRLSANRLTASASARPLIKYRSPFAVPDLVAANMEKHEHPLHRDHCQQFL